MAKKPWIIAKETLDAKYHDKGRFREQAVEVSENELTNIIENFKFLKLHIPRITVKRFSSWK